MIHSKREESCAASRVDREAIFFGRTMTSKVKSNSRPKSKPCEDCSYYQALKQKLKVSELLAKAIAKFEERRGGNRRGEGDQGDNSCGRATQSTCCGGTKNRARYTRSG